MSAVRSWYVIPALGAASVAAALAMHHAPVLALALGACGAALAAAIRAFVGSSLVGAIAAAGGAVVGALGLLALAPEAREVIAGTAALFAISELARAKLPQESPLPAVGAALLAGVLDPSYIALVPVAGVAWLLAPVARPRAAIAVPILGALATALAIGLATTHAHAGLWTTWLGHAPAHRPVLATLVRAGDLVGPLVACAALAGIAICLVHGRLAATALAAVLALTAIVSLSAGFVAPATPLVAALAAGVAIGRLAALVRLPVGQAFVGATVGFVLAVAPVWTLIAPR